MERELTRAAGAQGAALRVGLQGLAQIEPSPPRMASSRMSRGAGEPPPLAQRSRLLGIFKGPDKQPMLLRDNDEHPVPPEWRAPFERIVEVFLRGDFELSAHPVDGVKPIDPETADRIAGNLDAYGAPLALPSAAVWKGSIYRWMGGYWLFLVDLATAGEEAGDLAIHARLADAPGALLEVESVHVP